jgi:hypothetical protein
MPTAGEITLIFVVYSDLSTFVTPITMRKKRLHIFTLIVGTIVAVAIAFSQFVTPDFCTSAKEIKTEQTGGDAENQTTSFVSLPSFSIPAQVSVEVNLNPYCLFEIFFEEDIDENPEENDLLNTDRLFETMLRVIISPNAP